MIVHLFESTLFLAMAILIAHVTPLAARTRYAIVFTALMKFAIPSAIVPRLLALLGIEMTRLPKGTIFIEALAPLSASNLPAAHASVWPMLALIFWLAMTLALLTRAFVLGHAALKRALSGVLDADAREMAVLARACTRAGAPRTVRLTRSPSITNPVTVRILRPVIVLPSDTDLGDAELETILAHECAHIARRDNLRGIVESIFGCVLWFHPLVWIARRMLDAAREEACDAVVVASGDAAVYVSALGKVCGAALTPRAAGISCIVSNTIRERMESIMRFGTRRLLPHRAVTATVIAFLAVATIGIGVARALPSAEDDSATSPYKVVVTATRLDSSFDFSITVCHRTDGKVVQTARLISAVDQWGTAQSRRTDTDGDHTTTVRAKGNGDGSAIVEIQIDQAPAMVRTIVAKPAQAVKGAEPISLELKDAEIRDVLHTFGQLTKIDFVIDDDVTGHVSVTLHEVPWTEALEILLRQNNLRQERDGNTIYIHRK